MEEKVMNIEEVEEINENTTTLVGGRYFKSGIDEIRKVENILNKRRINESYISGRDFWDVIRFWIES